jgi:hypothetical protein
MEKYYINTAGDKVEKDLDYFLARYNFQDINEFDAYIIKIIRENRSYKEILKIV